MREDYKVMMASLRNFFLSLLALTFLGAVGPQPTEVVQLKFNDHPEEPCTPDYMRDMVYTKYSQYLLTESHGQEWLTGSNVWSFVLPHDSHYYCHIGGAVPTNCNTQLILEDARTLTAPFFNISTQELVVLYIPSFGGGGGGGGIIWADCWNRPVNDLFTLIHEGGHAQGLMHSGSWSCPGLDVGEDYTHATESLAGCAWSIYGDPYSAMGFNTASTHYSAWEQDLLGWKRPDTIKTVSASSVVVLTRSDLSTGFQEVRIPLPTPDYYYTLEYKDGVGVLIRLKVVYAFGPDFTGIVNSVYPDPWNHPLAITSTNTFYDSFRKIRVALVMSDSATSTLSITIGDPPLPQPNPRPCKGRKCR